MKWLREQKNPRGKYARWIVGPEALPYEIISQNGFDHIVPDCMSRRPDPSREEETQNDEPYLESHIFALKVEPTNEEWMERIRKEQSADEAIRFGLQQLTDKGEIREGRFKCYKRVHLDNRIIMRRNQIICPNTLRFKIVDTVHKQLGHPGAARTMYVVSENYVWPGTQLYVKDYCNHCSVCLENKASCQPKETLQPYKIEELQPRAVVAFDIAVLPWTRYSNRYFLLIVDIFSKYVELAAMKDQYATTIKDALRRSWVHRHGAFNIAVSDRARNVEVVNEFCHEIGAEKRRSSPEGDGLAERSIQSVKTLIRCLEAERNLPKSVIGQPFCRR